MPVSVALTANAINAALGYTAANAASVVAKDNGAGIGCFFVGTAFNIGGVAVGGTTAGSNIFTWDGASMVATAGAGTWRNVGSTTANPSNVMSIFQRIA